MPALILKAKSVSEELFTQLKTLKNDLSPKLCIIQVGQHAPSNSYIAQKQKTALALNIETELIQLSQDCSPDELRQTIQKLNDSKKVDAILLQLPLAGKNFTDTPASEFLNLISASKDADGLHPLNQGYLFTLESHSQNWTSPLPCTALGILRLLDHYNIELLSKNITIIGRSRLVGSPLVPLLSQRGATVSLCHSKTKELKTYTAKSDVIIVAAGVKHLLRKEHLPTNNRCVLIDVGIHQYLDSEGKKKLTGDIDPNCYDHCHSYSPVPGGVGPLTVACLMENTIRLALKKSKR